MSKKFVEFFKNKEIEKLKYIASIIDNLSIEEKSRIKKCIESNLGIPIECSFKKLVQICSILNKHNLDYCKILKSHPILQGFNPDTLEFRIKYYIEKFGKKEIDKHSYILKENPETIEQKINLLKSFGIEHFNLRILSYNSGTIKERIKKLSEILGIPFKKVIKIINQNPGIMNYPPETIIEKIRKLSEMFSNVKKMLIRNPSLIERSEQSIINKIEILKKHLNIPENQAKKIIEKNPLILNRSDNHIIRKIELLKKLGIQKELVLKQPRILTLSEKNIAVKVSFLKDYGIDLNDCPFTHSFKNKIYPRIKYLIETGKLEKVDLLKALIINDKEFANSILNISIDQWKNKLHKLIKEAEKYEKKILYESE